MAGAGNLGSGFIEMQQLVGRLIPPGSAPAGNLSTGSTTLVETVQSRQTHGVSRTAPRKLSTGTTRNELGSTREIGFPRR